MIKFAKRCIKRIIGKAYSIYIKKQQMNMIVNTHHDVSEIGENVFDARKYGFSLSESSILRLNKENIGEYISTWEAYQPRMRNDSHFVMSDDKYVFSMTFGKYIEVPRNYGLIQNGTIIPLDEEINIDNLYEFLLSKNGGVIKDRCGYNGYGVYVLKVVGGKLTYKDKEVTEDEIKKFVSEFKTGIIQSNVIQGSFENEIFDKSINTVRVISMKRKDADYHEVVAALQRIGTERSAPVDNFAQGGGSAPIDIETGMLGSMTCFNSFDDAGKRIFYDVHPDSGAQIQGRVVPHWNDIKQKIADITRKLPFFEYIAWDIVIKNDGIALIETNMKSSLDLFQVHGGMRNSYLGQKYREHGYIKE